MRVLKVLLPCIVSMAFAASAGAEIYQSKDAQGNTVYSDMPSQGAEEIKVPQTNSADPVIESPRPPPQENTPVTPESSARPASPVRQEMDDDDIYYGDDDDFDDLRDGRVIERRRGDDDGAQPIRDRPVVEPHRKVSRPAARVGGRR